MKSFPVYTSAFIRLYGFEVLTQSDTVIHVSLKDLFMLVLSTFDG